MLSRGPWSLFLALQISQAHEASMSALISTLAHESPLTDSIDFYLYSAFNKGHCHKTAVQISGLEIYYISDYISDTVHT